MKRKRKKGEEEDGGTRRIGNPNIQSKEGNPPFDGTMKRQKKGGVDISIRKSEFREKKNPKGKYLHLINWAKENEKL